jgi:hypothetical protein
MPPEPPSGKGTVFYRLFRSEFVRVYSKPLCSDSFSSFCCQEPREKEFQTNIKEAFNYYINVHIPNAVQMLETKESPSHLFEEFNSVDELHVITDSVKRGREKIEDNISLKTVLHHHGICMRHLGIVFACCKTDYWKERVAVEMILRICKNTAKILFRRSFERFRTPNNEAFVKFFIDYLVRPHLSPSIFLCHINLITRTYLSATLNWQESIGTAKLWRVSSCRTTTTKALNSKLNISHNYAIKSTSRTSLRHSQR